MNLLDYVTIQMQAPESDHDPIGELIRDLLAHGKPRLPWVTKWSAGGTEPVATAWKSSNDWYAMMQVLWIASDNDPNVRPSPLVSMRVAPSRIRETTQSLPTLGELITAIETRTWRR